MLDKSYYHKNFSLLKVLIKALYELPSCASGGICHVVTDDGNVRDGDLSYVLGECYGNDPFWNNHIEKPLAALICKLFLEMEYKQRVCFVELMFYAGNDELNTDECIEKWGQKIESSVRQHLEECENYK